MRYLKLITAITGLVLSALTVSGAHAAETSPFMSFRAAAPPPVGFIVFCAVNPNECYGDAVPPPPLTPPSQSITAALSDRAPLLGGPLLGEAILGGRWMQNCELPLLIETVAPNPFETQPSLAAAAPAPASASSTVVLDREMLTLIKNVNRGVNRRIRGRSDLQLSGMVEQWSLPLQQDGELFGDCEDFALEKRHELIAQGFPRAALSMAVVETRYGETHAVLIVSTDQGDMVLDSLSPKVKTWNTTGYRWMSRQVAGDTSAWVELGGVRG